jgi:hypothetical protein
VICWCSNPWPGYSRSFFSPLLQRWIRPRGSSSLRRRLRSARSTGEQKRLQQLLFLRVGMDCYLVQFIRVGWFTRLWWQLKLLEFHLTLVTCRWGPMTYLLVCFKWFGTFWFLQCEYSAWKFTVWFVQRVLF